MYMEPNPNFELGLKVFELEKKMLELEWWNQIVLKFWRIEPKSQPKKPPNRYLKYQKIVIKGLLKKKKNYTTFDLNMP
jgi:hypothetical protein